MSRSGAHSSQIMVVEMIFMLDICREAVKPSLDTMMGTDED